MAKCIFWTFWTFSAWIEAKLVPVYSKRHLTACLFLLHLFTFVWACFQFKNFQESIIKILSKFPSQFFLKSLNISVYISHSIDSITVTWVSLERSFLLQNLRNVHRHWRLWLEDINFILVLKTMMFYSLAVLVVKYCFYHPKIKLISLSNPIIFPKQYSISTFQVLPPPIPHPPPLWNLQLQCTLHMQDFARRWDYK